VAKKMTVTRNRRKFNNEETRNLLDYKISEMCLIASHP
jgi:hypothetical protein